MPKGENGKRKSTERQSHKLDSDKRARLEVVAIWVGLGLSLLATWSSWVAVRVSESANQLAADANRIAIEANRIARRNSQLDVTPKITCYFEPEPLDASSTRPINDLPHFIVENSGTIEISALEVWSRIFVFNEKGEMVSRDTTGGRRNKKIIFIPSLAVAETVTNQVSMSFPGISVFVFDATFYSVADRGRPYPHRSSWIYDGERLWTEKNSGTNSVFQRINERVREELNPLYSPAFPAP